MDSALIGFLAVVGIMFGTGSSVAGMVAQAGPMAKGVLLVLLVFSIISWAIIIHKLRVLKRVRRESRLFLQMFHDSGNLSTLYTRSLRMQHSPLAKIFIAGYKEFKRATEESQLVARRSGQGAAPAPNPSGDSILFGVRRALAVTASEETGKLEQTLIFLATTGSTTPFIGLFGTVWGVMNAFRGLGMRGSASIGVVAPGIAEALIATAAGLAAAIPAVMAYNYFVNKIRFLSADMENFSSLLLAHLEKHSVKL